MGFVNTVDSVGDVALTNSIVDKSIVEIKDNYAMTLGSYAFYGCKFLTTAVFQNVTSVDSSAFYACNALKTVDFHAATSFAGSNDFWACSALEALIIRSGTVAELKSSTGFSGSGIYKKTGYIYVPAALVDSYKTATNWATYANQIRAIEDYPEVCDPYSWEAVAKNIENDTYKDVYKIGDMVPLDLGSEGIINMQIAAFDADTLADGTGTAAITWVAKELLATSHRMNPAMAGSSGAYTEGTGSIGGWEKCEMRTYLQNTIKPLISPDVASLIQTVSKTQTANTVTSSSYSQTTVDEVWIPSKTEINGGLYGALFISDADRIKVVAGGTTMYRWYLRDVRAANGYQFNSVSNSGAFETTVSTSASRVCLGFCTGRTPA